MPEVRSKLIVLLKKYTVFLNFCFKPHLVLCIYTGIVRVYDPNVEEIACILSTAFHRHTYRPFVFVFLSSGGSKTNVSKKYQIRYLVFDKIRPNLRARERLTQNISLEGFSQ